LGGCGVVWCVVCVVGVLVVGGWGGGGGGVGDSHCTVRLLEFFKVPMVVIYTGFLCVATKLNLAY